MTSRQIKRRLIGRTITKVELRSFDDGRRGWADNPRIELDDGTYLAFLTQETDIGVYGTQLIVGPDRSYKHLRKRKGAA